MVLKNMSTVTAALTLIIGPVATNALGATVRQTGDRRAPLHATLRHTHRDARHDVARHVNAVDDAPSYRDRDYVFVPGRGILGEDCDMPTSTCPNEVRDTR